MLLSRGMARLVVIDSVAAPFRCEFGGPASVPRARCLQVLGATLRRLSCAFGSPVLCINQVRRLLPPAHPQLGRPRGLFRRVGGGRAGAVALVQWTLLWSCR